MHPVCPKSLLWLLLLHFNFLHTGVCRSKELMKKLGHTIGSTTRDGGTEPQTLQHLLQCLLLKVPHEVH